MAKKKKTSSAPVKPAKRLPAKPDKEPPVTEPEPEKNDPTRVSPQNGKTEGQ